ncbi:hypothetical protein FOA52_007488 [Chlamydomonas sp. UWO 241]|nr:hypothetical protein FOA52_007488 [Chlamydomonas sp. UWO 241]
MTGEVPYYAATVARARMQRMHDRLTAALAGSAPPPVATAKDYGGPKGKLQPKAASGQHPLLFSQQQGQQQQQQGQQQQQAESPWPGARAILQLKLFLSLFPTSDRRHPVTTPAALLIGRALSSCVATTAGEAAAGALLCGLQLHAAAPAGRHAPEAIEFLTDMLAAFLPLPAKGGGKVASSGSGPGGEPRVAPGVLAFASAPAALARMAAPAPLPPARALSLLATTAPGVRVCVCAHMAAPALLPPAHALALLARTGPGASAEVAACDDATRLALLCVALRAAERASACQRASCPDTFPQVTARLASAVRSLSRLRLPEELTQLRATVEAALTSGASECEAVRVPLSRGGPIRTAAVPGANRDFNPRFEDGFSRDRDYDPDRERAEARKLKRQLAKEKRGAMRELRKDSAFMADARDKERAVVDTERMDSQKNFYAELQAQQADMNSGGQGGMHKPLKKRKT